jgi:hypothetical protein
MIESADFTVKFKRLQDFFGRQLKPDQIAIYFDKLRYFDFDIITEAFEGLIESDQKVFPSLGTILGFCREARYRKLKKEIPSAQQQYGCSKCMSGYVHFIRGGKQYIGECAICHKGANNSRQVYLVQIDDAIIPAYFKSGKMFVADPNHRQRPMPDAVPVTTNKRLNEISLSPLIGTLLPEDRRELFGKYPLKGAAVVNNAIELQGAVML